MGATEHASPSPLASTKRPQAAKLRRRSTLDWTSGPPSERQHRYNSAIAQHTADVFFSLHAAGSTEPVYISETAHNAMNVDFRFFDLTVCHSSITRADAVTLKLWTKHDADKDWQYLMDLCVNLRYLHYIGNSLETLSQPLPENAILLHMSDGIYTTLEDSQPPLLAVPAPLPMSSSLPIPTEPTSSYEALTRLSALDACIRDAVDTRNALIKDITELVTSSSTSERFESPTALAVARDSCNMTRHRLESCQRTIRASRTALSAQRASLASRRAAMSSMRAAQDQAAGDLDSISSSLLAASASHTEVLSEMTAQRRRIAATLQSIYSIEPVPATSNASPHQPVHANAFAIRGLALPPNSDYSTTPSTAVTRISAALGHTAHLTRLLSFYLAIPLPYPLLTRASASAVEDPISLMPATSAAASAAQRTFPLHLTSGTLGSSSFYRFEYAVFLLNKNVEALVLGADAAAARRADPLSPIGRRVVDIRQTLPNLGVLLFGLAGGERVELPPRLRGSIVRGLSVSTARGLGLGSRESSLSRDGGSDAGSGNAREEALGWADGRRDKGKGRMNSGAGENGHAAAASLDLEGFGDAVRRELYSPG